MGTKNDPIKNKEDIKHNPDRKIDQDFKGYPAGNAKDEIIKPESEEWKKQSSVRVNKLISI